MKLNASTLSQLPIDTPTYDRDEIGIGIVHFGVGGFHRAHQAMYIDRLLDKGLAQDWGICGVGVMPVDRRMKEVLDAQNGLYTLILENPDGSRDARVIGSIVDYRYAPDDPESVIELLSAPSTRIISLTITEGGYNIDGPVAADRVNVFGLVAEALARRRDARRRFADHRVLRQHRRQRRHRSLRVHHLRRADPSRAGRVDRRKHQVSELDGGQDHSGHHARRDGRHQRAVRASRINGPSSPSRSPRGHSKTTSPTAGRPLKRSASSWSTM